MNIPPGILYLSHILPVVLFPSAVAYVVFSRLLSFQTTWIPILAAFFIQPIVFGLRLVYTSTMEWIDAQQRGAVPIPQIPDSWPGGLSNLVSIGKRLTSGYPGDFLLHWFEEYGNTILVRLLFSNQIGTTEPAYIKARYAYSPFCLVYRICWKQAMLATEFSNFWKGPVDNEWGYSLLGTGIFNTDERVIDFEIFDKHANDALNQTATRLREGYAVDIQDVVSRFTLDSATEFLFGKSADSLSAGLAYPEAASQKNAPSLSSHPSNIFVNAFMEEKVQSSNQQSKAETETLLGHLLRETEGFSFLSVVDYVPKLSWAFLDKQIIRDETVNMLLAGRDTTAATLTYAVYMLAEHPDMANRLRNEVLERVGSSRRPTHDDIKPMSYLRAFINETLRLYPPVPLDSRASKEATTWPATTSGGKPFYVPAKTKVIYSVFLMHRRTDLWGPDALEFDPDRFMDERLHKYLTPNPYIFLPFNAGSMLTICIDVHLQFAYHEVSFFLVRLLQRFKSFTLAPDAQPEYSKAPPSWKSSPVKSREKIIFGTSLTIYAKGGLWVKMQEA
ncbi:Glycosyltransferase family 39 protein [Mycena venus]|uniref:Glycosyltransferase family 39 protein n=1 Tax=Mycena venus TaxID=2733690 RepID=A0A8H6YFL6_9AGAR|nr:Glycosyltransferase family 39 protein [Mycena venus]